MEPTYSNTRLEIQKRASNISSIFPKAPPSVYKKPTKRTVNRRLNKTTTSVKNDELDILQQTPCNNNHYNEQELDAALTVMIDTWSTTGATQSCFSSVVLYAEVKLQEALRMSASFSIPNKFITHVCLTLLQCLSKRLGSSTGSTLSSITSIVKSCIICNTNKLPYFTLESNLQQQLLKMSQELQVKEEIISRARQQNYKNATSVRHTIGRLTKPLIQVYFAQWRATVKRRDAVFNIVAKAFESKAKLKDCFRGWRIQALRGSYDRESEDYQAMLTITSDTLNRKDMELRDAKEEIKNLKAQLNKATALNKDYVKKVRKMEVQLRKAFVEVGSTRRRRASKLLEDPLILQVDGDEETGSNNKVNKTLLEALSSMARMVETVSLSATKDVVADLTVGRYFGGSSNPFITQLVKSSSDNDDDAWKSLFTKNAVADKTNSGFALDVFLLQWCNYILKGSSTLTMKNFGTDLADGKIISVLLHATFPHEFPSGTCNGLDKNECIDFIISFLASKATSNDNNAVSSILTRESISDATSNLIFISWLFTLHSDSSNSNNATDVANNIKALLSTAVASWKNVRSLLLQIKTTNDHENHDERLTLKLLSDFATSVHTCSNHMQQLRRSVSDTLTLTTNTSAVEVAVASATLRTSWSILTSSDISSSDLCDTALENLRQTYSVVNPALIKDVLKFITTDKITKTLRPVAKDLHDIFLHYAAGVSDHGLGDAMSCSEFHKFVKEIKLGTSSSSLLPKPAIDTIFQLTLINQKNTSTAELNGNQFTQALLRLAFKVFDSENALELLLNNHVLVNAARSSLDVFRKSLESFQITSVFEKHGSSLKKIFKCYATTVGNDYGIDKVGFATLVKDLHILSLNDFAIRQIFINIQHSSDSDNLSLKEEANNVVDYEEFKEAMAVLALHVHCNPYLPLYLRLDLFLQKLRRKPLV